MKINIRKLSLKTIIKKYIFFKIHIHQKPSFILNKKMLKEFFLVI